MLSKAMISMLVIFAIEFILGWLLDQLAGKCPWEYQEGWHVAGYIRLDFAPAWFVFAWMVIYIHDLLINGCANQHK
ncbi:MAG: putative ABC transporter permease [Flavobacteriales bacterium]